MKRQLILILLITTITILSLCNQTTPAKAQDDGLWLALILLTGDFNTPEDLAQVQTAVKIHEGQIIHTFPNQATIAKLPSNAVKKLVTLPNVAGVFTRTIELSQVDIYGPNARRVAAAWNEVVAPQPPTANLAAADYPEEHHDAFIAPDLPPSEDVDLIATDIPTVPGYYQTSEFMAGSVAVGIVLVESDGAVDPSTENWTDDEKQRVFSEIVGALNWWAELEPRANLSFVYDDHFTKPLATSVEPISRPYRDQQYWIADAMGALGFSAPSYFTRVRDYNNHLRQVFQTDWAFTIFVVDSSADGDNRFSDGYFAYAYLGGPFMVMTYGNNGYGPSNLDAVAAHEIGHIFLALDQYYNAAQPCDRKAGYLSVPNQNSQYGTCASNVTSIMRGQTYPYRARSIDPYAAGQLGWQDSDGDNILDPLDVDLPVSIDILAPTGNDIYVNGTAQIIPCPSPNRTSVTINSLTGVQYRLDDQEWQLATPIDGRFDGVTETYEFAATGLAPGVHRLEVAATDTAGNISEIYAAETISVMDPIDGGLNTELFSPPVDLTAGNVSVIHGIAYHLQNGTVARVDYRLNGGSWQMAAPQDSNFGSNYEPFTLSIESLEPGSYLIEAFATDAEGNQEMNIASQRIEVSQVHISFLPLVLKE